MPDTGISLLPVQNAQCAIMPSAPAGKIRIYFENLNAIRCIAALLVIVYHIEQFKDLFHIPGHWNNKVITLIGPLGVILFFVLSGFLITALLLKEQEISHTVSIRAFYIRRILRIWPLYFLIIVCAFFIFPQIDFLSIPGYGNEMTLQYTGIKLLMFVFFLPNLVLVMYGMIPFASQTWSIGAEEQFYLLWPVLIKKITRKWVLMLAVILIYILIKLWADHISPGSKAISAFSSFWNTIPVDCMAIGGIFALIINDKRPFVIRLRQLIFTKYFQWFVLILTLFFIIKGIHFSSLHPEIYALLFGLLIVNFAANDERIFSMENKWFNYSGKISYGLYMYHPVAIVFCIRIFQVLHLNIDYRIYPAALVLTGLMAILSYEFFEKWFLKKKARYSILMSGDKATE